MKCQHECLHVEESGMAASSMSNSRVVGLIGRLPCQCLLAMCVSDECFAMASVGTDGGKCCCNATVHIHSVNHNKGE